MKMIRFLVVLVLYAYVASVNAMPSWMALEKGCNFSSSLKNRFKEDIEPARNFILNNSEKPETIGNVKIEFSCSPNSLSIASYVHKGKERIIVGAGFLDTAERLADVYYIMHISGVDHNKYIKYLAKSIVAKTPYDEIKMPVDYYKLSGNKLKQFRSGTGRATRGGFFGGMLIFALGHEYGHVRYKHLTKGIRTKTREPRNAKEGYQFRKQEYMSDFFASYVLQEGKLPVFVGVLLNEFMIEIGKLGGTYTVLNSHPPTYARSLYLIADQIYSIRNQAGLSKKQKVKQITALNKMKVELQFEMFDELGEYKLRKHISESKFNQCMKKKHKACHKSCSQSQKFSVSQCNYMCSGSKQKKSNVVRCHLKFAR